MALDPGIKAVGFDMDGTFMRTYVNYFKLSRVVTSEFSDLGVPDEVLRTDNYKFTLENGKDWLRKNGLADRVPGIEERIGARATEIEMEHADLAVPFPGAVDTLERLKSEGYKVGILTRGGRAYVTKVLGESGILDEFDALVARDDYPEEEAKPSALAMEHLAQKLGVDCEEILYLGDGLVDYLTAKNSGASFIGVETGRNSRDYWIQKVGDVRVIHSVRDLLPMLRSLPVLQELDAVRFRHILGEGFGEHADSHPAGIECYKVRWLGIGVRLKHDLFDVLRPFQKT